MAVRLDDLPGRRGPADRHQLVPGRQDRHPRAPVDDELGPAEARGERDGARIERRARRDRDPPGRHVRAPRPHEPAPHRLAQERGAPPRAADLLLLLDRVGAVGDGRAGEDPAAGARGERARCGAAGEDLEGDREPRPGPPHVARPERVPVHRGGVERGEVSPGDEVLGEGPAERGLERYALGGEWRDVGERREDPGESRRRREHGPFIAQNAGVPAPSRGLRSPAGARIRVDSRARMPYQRRTPSRRVQPRHPVRSVVALRSPAVSARSPAGARRRVPRGGALPLLPSEQGSGSDGLGEMVRPGGRCGRGQAGPAPRGAPRGAEARRGTAAVGGRPHAAGAASPGRADRGEAGAPRSRARGAARPRRQALLDAAARRSPVPRPRRSRRRLEAAARRSRACSAR